MNIQHVISVVAPHVDAAMWAGALEAPMQHAGINTPRRAAMFLGQCAEESGGFTVLEENLWYHADRICAVWPSRFPAPESAVPFAGKPEALANHVYTGRGGNGDEAGGDGWRFRGRGLIQLTFRDNYASCAASLGRPLDDAFLSWLATRPGAAASACWYWGRYPSLLARSDVFDVEGVTRVINGGLTNLDTRRRLCLAALAAANAA